MVQALMSWVSLDCLPMHLSPNGRLEQLGYPAIILRSDECRCAEQRCGGVEPAGRRDGQRGEDGMLGGGVVVI